MTRTILGTMTLAATMFAQAPLTFEVATIKPAEPIVAAAGQRPVNVGVHINGQQFIANSMSLRDYLGIAYNMRIYQIEGPEWIASERYDINAKMPVLPDGRTLKDEEFAPMMRALVEERFALKSHRISREFPIYALVQMKDGIKAKEAPLDAPGDSVTIGGAGGPQGTVISLGRGSTLTIGGNRIAATKVSMLTLAETLARFVDRPVQDHTGLTPTYDIELNVTQEDFQALMIRSAVAAGVTLPPQALKLLETASGDSLHEALARIGLKLEQRKVPLEVLVIDAANKAPMEN